MIVMTDFKTMRPKIERDWLMVVGVGVIVYKNGIDVKYKSAAIADNIVTLCDDHHKKVYAKK